MTNDPFWTPGAMFDQQMIMDGFAKQALADMKADPEFQFNFDPGFTAPTVNPSVSSNDPNIPTYNGSTGEFVKPYREEAGTLKQPSQLKAYLPHIATAAMGALGDRWQRNESRDSYNRMLKFLGNTDSRQATNPDNPFGNHTLNAGIGPNFRPNQTGFRNFEEGGEYEMSEDELKQFLENGGEVEIL